MESKKKVIGVTCVVLIVGSISWATSVLSGPPKLPAEAQRIVNSSRNEQANATSRTQKRRPVSASTNAVDEQMLVNTQSDPVTVGTDSQSKEKANKKKFKRRTRHPRQQTEYEEEVPVDRAGAVESTKKKPRSGRVKQDT